MEIKETKLPGVYILTPNQYPDPRGYFSETWSQKAMAAKGLDYTWVQDNMSMSFEVGTVRGLHFQSPPHAQAKLVRCAKGALFDVAVDVRRGSPTYGQWVGEELTPENRKQLLIPTGFLHGFVTRLPDTEINYKCSDIYAPDCDGSVRFDCPTIGIDWGLTGTEAVLSEKDMRAGGLDTFDSPFEYEG